MQAQVSHYRSFPSPSPSSSTPTSSRDTTILSFTVFQETLKHQITYPPSLDKDARDLIEKLLSKDPLQRSGAGLAAAAAEAFIEAKVPAAAMAATTTAPSLPPGPADVSGYEVKNGFDALKSHPFFNGIDWSALPGSSVPQKDHLAELAKKRAPTSKTPKADVGRIEDVDKEFEEILEAEKAAAEEDQVAVVEPLDESKLAELNAQHGHDIVGELELDPETGTVTMKQQSASTSKSESTDSTSGG